LPLWRNDDTPSIINLLASSLCVLEKLTWLQYLELDAKLLNDEATVSALLRCSIASLERVRFVVECPYKEVLWRKADPPTYIWGELGDRLLLTGGFSEHVARSMKSQSIDVLAIDQTSTMNM
jgi:hypothetical protein